MVLFCPTCGNYGLDIGDDGEEEAGSACGFRGCEGRFAKAWISESSEEDPILSLPMDEAQLNLIEERTSYRHPGEMGHPTIEDAERYYDVMRLLKEIRRLLSYDDSEKVLPNMG